MGGTSTIIHRVKLTILASMVASCYQPYEMCGNPSQWERYISHVGSQHNKHG